MASIELQSLSKSFRGSDGQTIPALQDISLSLNEGAFLAIVGPSGSGKTTLLRIIAGLEQSTSGCINIHGQPVTGQPPGQRDVAMVFQDPALYPHLTVRKNIEFPLKLRKVPSTLIQQRLFDISARLGLDHLLDRLPSELSGGQQQRVALGRAMIRHPQVFLMDEPLSNLDAPAREELRALIVQMHRDTAVPMVYVTHDQSEAMSFPGNLAVMHQGRLEQIDRPIEVYLHPCNTFIAQFLGTPSMNLLTGTVVQDGNHSGFRFSAPSQAHGSTLLLGFPIAPSFPPGFSESDPVVLGIRPDDIVWQKTSPTGSFVKLPLEVQAVNLRGEHGVISATLGGHPFHATVPLRQMNLTWNDVSSFVAMEHMHFFDGRTSKRLSTE